MVRVWTGAARTACAYRTRTRALGHAEGPRPDGSLYSTPRRPHPAPRVAARTR